MITQKEIEIRKRIHLRGQQPDVNGLEDLTLKEIRERECIWHYLLHDDKSTSGKDMRTSMLAFAVYKCDQCFGYARENACRGYYSMKQYGGKK